VALSREVAARALSEISDFLLAFICFTQSSAVPPRKRHRFAGHYAGTRDDGMHAAEFPRVDNYQPTAYWDTSDLAHNYALATEKTRRIPFTPLLDPGEWCRALTEHGFSGIEVADGGTPGCAQSVIAATRGRDD